MVIGPCGAGKSTVSRRLAKLLELPLHHLDRLHWEAGWIEGSQDELRAALAPILAADRWLIDGNYGSTMEARLARADAVIYLDYPTLLCLWRAARRVFEYRGRSRPDMTEGCPERFDYEFFRYIFNWNTGPRVRTEALLQGHETKVLRFGNPTELERWLGKLENET
ncbi:P-loop NTPase family protein [Parerythrobacter jejuensis]|uniref:Topology modulation protein n=1 Tax=Parerythrobacter jejuensis TaxID=795812 RepID=A0A845ASF4_9SPHN|nr:topology modulation protein [Parerythrobacter jejuensis]MXP32307.1 topology modulation protein [Parerythrobacter jejuensis]